MFVGIIIWIVEGSEVYFKYYYFLVVDLREVDILERKLKEIGIDKR